MKDKYTVHIGPGRKLGAVLLIAPEDTESGIAIVLHTLPPKSLAAPPHLHTCEDEISHVVSGELTVWEEGKVQTVPAGKTVIKARNILHTFWNQGTEPLTFLEIIAPGNFANFFREVATVQPDGAWSQEDIERVGALAGEYGLRFDFSLIPGIMEQYGLEP